MPTGNTGLLTARCDPYGAESTVSLLGGIYPASQVGRIMWHCPKTAEGRYRLICTGGVYGGRLASDGGIVPAYMCEGGHRGVVMPLCRDHVRSIGKRQSELCPACAFPPAVREVAAALQARQADMHNAFSLGYLAAAAKLGAAVEDLQAQMNDFSLRGIVHRCPLEMKEVS
jgi:hypothetical protein